MQQGSKNPWFDFEELQKDAKARSEGKRRVCYEKNDKKRCKKFNVVATQCLYQSSC